MKLTVMRFIISLAAFCIVFYAYRRQKRDDE